MKSLLSLFIVLFSIVLNAQRFDFGKVSEEEIKQKEHPNDPEAPATYIYKKGKVTFTHDKIWRYVYEVEGRIKIYKKEGYEYATINVPLFREGAGSNEIFSNFKGFTYNIVDGKTTKERVENNQIFDIDVNEFWDMKRVTFPNIQEGSVIEYSYTITSPFIQALPEFYFQDQIPVEYAEYTMEIPEYLGFKTHIRERVELKRESSSRLKGLMYSYIPDNQQIKALNANKTHHASVTILFTTIKYSSQNAPKVLQEDYMNSYRNYLTSIRPELEWEKYSENTPVKKHSTSWEDIAKSITRHRSFGEELEKRNYFKSELTSALAGTSSQIEKVKAIYNYVNKNIVWNKFYSIYSNEGLEKAFAKKTGNVAEVNLILTAMLKEANLDAYPVLVSTKSNGIPLFPTNTGFNYVICAVKVNNELLLLDATETYASPNILPERTLNWYGRLIKNKDESEQVEVIPKSPSRRIVNMEVNLNEGGKMEGKLRNTYTDHLALEIRDSYASLSDEKYIENLENRYSSLSVSNFSFQNKKDPYKPLVEGYDFEYTNAFDQMGDKIYFQPSFFLISTKNPFIAETRSYPIDFKYPTQETYMINIFVPDGYQVESLPQSEIFELPGGLGDFKYMISHTDTNIQLRIDTSINSTLVPADFYEPLKAFFEAKVTKLSEKITLSRI
ncbi:MAG: transglutaminase domain-containing protein [Flavobacteriaceae bacterium]